MLACYRLVTDLLRGSYGETGIINFGKTCYGEVAHLFQTCYGLVIVRLCCGLATGKLV